MGATNRLKQALTSKWTWLIHALFLRKDAAWLLSEFETSPTHVEISQWKAKTEELVQTLAEANRKVELLATELTDSEQRAECEYAKLKAKYDKRLRATESDQAEALKAEILSVRNEKHLIQIELNQIKEQLAKYVAEHEKAKDGNRALLRFIHTRHRLNVPMEPNSLRAVLQKSDENS